MKSVKKKTVLIWNFIGYFFAWISVFITIRWKISIQNNPIPMKPIIPILRKAHLWLKPLSMITFVSCLTDSTVMAMTKERPMT